MKLLTSTLISMAFTSLIHTNVGFASEPNISIVDGKADANRGKISQIESEVNLALTDFQNQIDSIALTPGPEGPQGVEGPQGDSGILPIAGTACPIGEVVAAFSNTGEIICAAANASVVPEMGEDCADFKLGLVLYGILDLRNCDLRHLHRSNFNFEDSNFEGADLRNSVLTSISFERANLSGANMEGASLRGSSFTGADLSSANLNHADLGCAYNVLSGGGAQATDCTRLRDALLTNTILTGANLKGVEQLPLPDQWNSTGGVQDSIARPTWGNTVCPDGSNSFDPDGDQSTCYYNTTPDQALP